MAVYYCIPLEDGLRSEKNSGITTEEKEAFCVGGFIVKLIN
jgi:hypothetical protein